MDEEVELYELEAQSLDWLVIIAGLVNKLGPKSDEDAHTHMLDSGYAVFHINKKFATAAQIAKAIGSTPEKVAKAKKITLAPLVGAKDWQAPTVDYYGSA